MWSSSKEHEIADRQAAQRSSAPPEDGALGDAVRLVQTDHEEAKPVQGSTPGSISVDEFTEATFKAVLRASEARKAESVSPRVPIKPGPIIYGIIWWPEGGPGGEGPIFAGPSGPAEA